MLFLTLKPSTHPCDARYCHRYVACRGGEVNSVPCLFREQTTAYCACYVTHIVLLCFFLFHWLADALLLPRFARAVRLGSGCDGVRDGFGGSCSGHGPYGFCSERSIIPVVVVLTAVLVPMYVVINWDNCNCPCPELSAGGVSTDVAEALRRAAGTNCSTMVPGR